MLAKCPCYPPRVEASGLILFHIADVRHAFFQRDKDMGKQRTALLTCRPVPTPRLAGELRSTSRFVPPTTSALSLPRRKAESRRETRLNSYLLQRMLANPGVVNFFARICAKFARAMARPGYGLGDRHVIRYPVGNNAAYGAICARRDADDRRR